LSERLSPPSDSADLLIELGCEELPPKSLDALREAFFAGIAAGLDKQGVTYDASGSRCFSTPRRLAAFFSQVAGGQADTIQERRGPAVSAAFDADGNPTAAALGFARSVGLPVDALQQLETDKGQWLYARVEQQGQSLDDLIFPILEQAVRQLPVPRPMRWGDNEFSFVRPVHWLVVLHGKRVVEGALLGQTSGRATRGHRVHAPGPFDLPSSAAYAEVLADAYVVADPERRRADIRQSLMDADPDVLIDPDLLSEVSNLVEWPVAVACEFEKEFLAVPHAALIASMQDHQKFFPVRASDEAGKVTNRFVAIANLESQEVGAVREGYERVIRPRLADARFFLEQDQKRSLESYLPALDQIVFQEKIGSIGDKSRRMSSFSQNIAELLGFDPVTSGRAALLAKCDLLTQMVGEFPELQGEMGAHYALHSKEVAEVATAIGEHYAPAFAGDAIPSSAAGRIVSIADRADSLVGIFAAGLRPSGNKDPFALRRAALGLVRILLEAGLDLPLNRVLAAAANELSSQIDVQPTLLVEVRDFVVERLRHYYRDQGHGAELIQAALSSDWDTLPDLDRRLAALASFMGEPAAASLAAANKRIGNMLRKAEEECSEEIDAKIFVFEEEVALFGEIERLENELKPLLEERNYGSCLQALSRLKEPVDAFFDAVMVLDEDRLLRQNRLALLTRLKALFDHIADLSVLG
jgi:glycyl-tRNA synthetase beta chain